MAAAARPLVTVYTVEATDTPETISIPDVMRAPIRPDIVNFVHTNISKNSRQPYAVSRKAGHQTSAVSWGTGRAVSRIPRVAGGGTHRAGQAAFGNMCRGGRMFAPTRIWRKWHRKINLNQKRYAVVSAIAASAIPSLVLARGHLIESVPEIPLVVGDYAECVEKTKDAIKILKSVGAYPDAEKAKDSLAIRSGKGKMRNRKYISRKGPLIVYGTEGAKAVKAFRNIPGVEITNVERLNLLKLAPGGHLGRFVIWTKSAFEKLDSIYDKASEKKKKGYVLPRAKMVNSDVTRIINSDEVQSVVRPVKKEVKRAALKKNPLKNLNVMHKLNPYYKTAKRMVLLAEDERVELEAAKKRIARKTVVSISGEGYDQISGFKYKIHFDESSSWTMTSICPNWPRRSRTYKKSVSPYLRAMCPVKTPIEKLEEELKFKEIILNSVQKRIANLNDCTAKSIFEDQERRLKCELYILVDELKEMKDRERRQLKCELVKLDELKEMKEEWERQQLECELDKTG